MQEEIVQRFMGHVLSDLAAANSGVMVNLGHRLGLYRCLAAQGPLSAEELAQQTETHPRYIREWLLSQVAGGYVLREAGGGRFVLPPEHAAILADTESPLLMAPAFSAAGSMYIDEDKTLAIFKSGEGMAWGEHDHRLFGAVEAFFRNGYRENLTPLWIPSLEGVTAKLERGGRVADVGCGHGVSTLLMAKAYPRSEVVGYDAHQGSVETAKQRAAEGGLSENVRFELADARTFDGGPYDLICFMDSYHDLGDPQIAAARARSQLAEDGTLMLVEPFANAELEQNVGPVARLYFSASTTMCTPNALAQGKLALGAQAGPEQLAGTLHEAGFSRVRVVHENAFNIVIEAKV